jgi:hypothetical protein
MTHHEAKDAQKTVAKQPSAAASRSVRQGGARANDNDPGSVDTGGGKAGLAVVLQPPSAPTPQPPGGTAHQLSSGGSDPKVNDKPGPAVP